jgi:hypothetical protein
MQMRVSGEKAIRRVPLANGFPFDLDGPLRAIAAETRRPPIHPREAVRDMIFKAFKILLVILQSEAAYRH